MSPVPAVPSVARPGAGAARVRELEKHVEARGDDLMASHGFDAIRFSQSRATRQTAGIPDRKYYQPALGVAVWWEAKTATGRQRTKQRAFQAMCEACGEAYVLGTDAALVAWLSNPDGPWQRALRTRRPDHPSRSLTR